MANKKDEWLSDLKKKIPGIPPEEVKTLLDEQSNGCLVVVDVREGEEHRAGASGR